MSNIADFLDNWPEFCMWNAGARASLDNAIARRVEEWQEGLSARVTDCMSTHDLDNLSEAIRGLMASAVLLVIRHPFEASYEEEMIEDTLAKFRAKAEANVPPESLAPVVGAEGGACSNVPGPVVEVTESGSGHGVAGEDASALARASNFTEHDYVIGSARASTEDVPC